MGHRTFAMLTATFAAQPTPQDSALLSFDGVDGADVFNCSAPFTWQGRRYIYGRVEQRDEVSESRSRLFAHSEKDTYAIVDDVIARHLEDPFVAKVGGKFLLGGTQITKNVGKVHNFFCDFYQSTDPKQPVYFTTGPDRKRHVRVVELADGRLGVFAPADEDGTIGFTTVDDLSKLTLDRVALAEPIDASIFGGATGGVNHAYLLSSGAIGCLSTHKESDVKDTFATSFVFDPSSGTVSNFKVLAGTQSFPAYPAKAGHILPMVFSSGLVRRESGVYDLYCGLGGTSEGRVTVDYPFEGYGAIASELVF